MIRYLLAVLTLAACVPVPTPAQSTIAITPRATTTRGVAATAAPISTLSLPPTATNQPPPIQPTISPLDYQAICDQHDVLTNVQWEAYIEGLKGQRGEWSGAVWQVTQDAFTDKYYVILDLDNDTFPDMDAWDIDQQTAIALQKGQGVRIAGDLDSASYFLTSCRLVVVGAEILP